MHKRTLKTHSSNVSKQPSLDEASAAIKTLLRYIGEDPSREGLLDTQHRVLRAWAEFTAGYAVDVKELLKRTFDSGSSEMVVVRGIDFVSFCEHHMVPFTGVAHVAYLPSGRVVGLSKLARCVQAFAKRLQIQERLTRQIAQAISEHVSCAGVGVQIVATHQCMAHRGVRCTSAETITTSLLGEFMTDAAVRQEFLSAIGR